MARYRKLNREERESIRNAITAHRLPYRDLAKALKMSQAYLGQILGSIRPLRRKYAEQIYKVLDEDPSVEFLRDYKEDFRSNPRDGFSGDTDAAWLNLYYAYCKKLETLTSGQYKTRVLILNELEELVNKYSKS